MPPFPTPRFSHLLGTIALAPTMIGFGVIGLGMVAAMASAHAAPATDPGGFQDETTTIVLHNAAKPADPAAQRKLHRRIADAALSVCGGGGGSLPEVDRTIRNSSCWHEAMTHAEAQIAR